MILHIHFLYPDNNEKESGLLLTLSLSHLIEVERICDILNIFVRVIIRIAIVIKRHDIYHHKAVFEVCRDEGSSPASDVFTL